MCFLIVFHSPSSENRGSFFRVVPEFSLCSCFEVSEIASELVVGIDLIKCVLVSKEFVFSEANIISFLIEFV